LEPPSQADFICFVLLFALAGVPGSSEATAFSHSLLACDMVGFFFRRCQIALIYVLYGLYTSLCCILNRSVRLYLFVSLCMSRMRIIGLLLSLFTNVLLLTDPFGSLAPGLERHPHLFKL